MDNPSGGSSGPPSSGPQPHQPHHPPQPSAPGQAPGQQPTQPYPPQPAPGQAPGSTQQYPQQPAPGQGPDPTQQYPTPPGTGQQPAGAYPPQQPYPGQGPGPTQQFPQQPYQQQYPPQGQVPTQQYPYQQQYSPYGQPGGAGPSGNNNTVLWTILAIVMVAGLGVALFLIFRNGDSGGVAAPTTTRSPSTTTPLIVPVTAVAPTVTPAPLPTSPPTTPAPVTVAPTVPPTPVTEPVVTPGVPDGELYTDPGGNYSITLGPDWVRYESSSNTGGFDQWTVGEDSLDAPFVQIFVTPAFGTTLEDEMSVPDDSFSDVLGVPVDVIDKRTTVGAYGQEMGVIHLRVNDEDDRGTSDFLMVIEVSDERERFAFAGAPTSVFETARPSFEPYLLTLQGA